MTPTSRTDDRFVYVLYNEFPHVQIKGLIIHETFITGPPTHSVL